jgi:desumoylating isopeptidase 1
MSFEVVLHIYDLSMGAARSMSMMILGSQIDLIPHTGIVYRGLEYFFGGGIKALPPQEVVDIFGLHPVERLVLGQTTKTEADIKEFLRHISRRFTMDTYDLFSNNCNHFSSTFSTFLVGSPIPLRITDIPRIVLSTPLGAMLGQTMSGMNNRFNAHTGGDPFSALAEARGTTHIESFAGNTLGHSQAPLTASQNVIKSTTKTLLSNSILECTASFYCLQQFFKDDSDKIRTLEFLQHFVCFEKVNGVLTQNIKDSITLLADTLKNSSYRMSALYLLRVLVLNKDCHTMLINNNIADLIITMFLTSNDSTSEICSSQVTVLALLFISNAWNLGSTWFKKDMKVVTQIISKHICHENATVRIATAVFALNTVNNASSCNETIEFIFQLFVKEETLVNECDETALRYKLLTICRLALQDKDQYKQKIALTCDKMIKRTNLTEDVKQLLLEVITSTKSVD